MPDHADLVPPRHRAGRWSALAGAVLAISLFPGPAAHAGDGLVGDVTDVAGTVTDPVVDSALETVETAVPPAEQVVEPVVEDVVEDVVEPTVSEVEKATEKVTGDDGGAPPEREGPAQEKRAGQTGDSDGQPDAQAAEPATASQPAAATVTPASSSGGGGGNAPGAAGRGDEQGSAAADGPRGGQRPSAAACDGISDLPARGAVVPVIQHGGGTSDAEVAGASEGDSGGGDTSDRDGALDLPAEAGPAPALDAPDAARALWLAGLVALVLLLAAGATVVLVRELE